MPAGCIYAVKTPQWTSTLYKHTHTHTHTPPYRPITSPDSSDFRSDFRSVETLVSKSVTTFFSFSYSTVLLDFCTGTEAWECHCLHTHAHTHRQSCVFCGVCSFMSCCVLAVLSWTHRVSSLLSPLKLLRPSEWMRLSWRCLQERRERVLKRKVNIIRLACVRVWTPWRPRGESALSYMWSAFDLEDFTL